MKKIHNYKKAFQNFSIFLIIAAILGILLIPCHSSLYKSVKQGVIEQNNNKIHQEIKMMENEINLQINMTKNITAGRDFKILSNPPAYGHSTSDQEWFESRESVRKSYSALKSIVSFQDKSFVLFRNSDVQIDTNGSVDDFRASYDALWRLTVDNEKCSFDAATLQMFFKKHNGQFESNIGYYDMTNGKKYELIYLLTLSSTDEELGNDSVFIACYDAEKLIDRFEFGENVSSVLICDENDKKIFTYGEDYDISVYDSCFKSDNLNIKVYYSISENCMNEYMQPINLFILIALLFFVVFGLIMTFGIAMAERKNMRKFIKITNGISDIEFSENDDHYKYLELIFRNIHKKSMDSESEVKNLIFTKMLGFDLSEKELGYVEKYFSSLVCILVLKNTAEKYGNMKNDVFVFLKKNNVELLHDVTVNSTENVFFIKMSASLKEVIEDMIVHINKENHANLRGVCTVCDDISSVPKIFEKLKKDINYIEYGTLKFNKSFDESADNGDFKQIIAKSRQLYEIIKSGNDFEAKRIVYEQWYKITQDSINTENIGSLFFSQTSILLQIMSENNIRVQIPRFDSEKDVVTIAFEITECIEQICEKVKGTERKADVRISQIVEYINQRYCDSSFYMPELVGKFELSDRAIVQMLKKSTGDNFSNYLSKLRIAKAKDMLETTNIPVSEVATASGFDSSNSLYKAFKKVYGVSPSMYRSNRKNGSESSQ